MSRVLPFPSRGADRLRRVERAQLDGALCAAHASGDSQALARLYAQAADLTHDDDSAAFYLTHAYVYALDSGASDTPVLLDRLVGLGREERRPSISQPLAHTLT